MRRISQFFAKRVSLAVLGGFLFLLFFLVIFKAVNSDRIRRQNIKNMVAKSVIGCLRNAKDQPAVDCRALFLSVSNEVEELRFEIWVEHPDGKILWQNTEINAPTIERAFGERPGAYLLIEKRTLTSMVFSVPNGYVDDPLTQFRIVVGEPLSGNPYVTLRNRVLFLVVALFIFGILWSSLISFFVLARRAKEAQRVLKELRAGNLSARFNAEALDELSELSSSFNQMVDLLATSLQEVKRSEENRKMLVSELSHDLRTPLTSMTSFLQILEGKSISEELRKECLDSIRIETNYLNQLVASLFELSRIESAQTEASREVIDLAKITREIKTEFELSAQTRSIHFHSAVVDSEVLILGDAVLARRMLCNLIDNAFQHARKEIHFRVGVNLEKDCVQIEIRDDGPGLPDAIRKNFGRSAGGRSLESGNQQFHLGLGSVIAVKIAKLHHGEILVENIPNGGAQVQIFIPLFKVTG